MSRSKPVDTVPISAFQILKKKQPLYIFSLEINANPKEFNDKYDF